MDNTLGKRIQMLRIKRSHTQVELAHRIGETLDTINKIESEKIVVKSLPECETKFFHLVSKELTSTTTSEHDSTNGPLEVCVCLSRKSKF